MKLQQLYRFIVALFAPPYCYACKIFLLEKSVFCQPCHSLIKPIVSIDVFVTKKYSLTVHAVSGYEGPLKKLVLAKTLSDQVAALDLGEMVWNKLKNMPDFFDVIVPVPLHWSRFAKRGYNQAEIIARVLAQKSNKPVVNLLKRKVNSSLQAKLSAEQRVENVKNIFQLAHTDYSYQKKRLLLVDDLMTTGATLSSAAHELLKLKPASIDAVVPCRVI